MAAPTAKPKKPAAAKKPATRRKAAPKAKRKAAPAAESEPSTAKGGRPTKYRAEFVEQARKICDILGATDDQLAEFFGVTTSTIGMWKVRHPEFSEALKIGKDVPDDRVEASLYMKAVGFTREAVKIFMPAGAAKPVYARYQEYYPPDTTAAIFWLKNRRPAQWRDRVEQTHSVDAAFLNLWKRVGGGGDGEEGK